MEYLKKIFTFPKWKIIEEKDQFGNFRYRALARYGFFCMWWHLQWLNDKKVFATIECNPKYVESYKEAESLILSDQKWEKDKEKARSEESKSKKIEPKFKKVLTVKY